MPNLAALRLSLVELKGIIQNAISNPTKKNKKKAYPKKALEKSADLVKELLLMLDEPTLPSINLSNFLVELLKNENMADSRLYESQIDAKVACLFQHFFTIENEFLIKPQWRMNPQVNDAFLKAVRDWSMIAEKDDTSIHLSDFDDLTESSTNDIAIPAPSISPPVTGLSSGESIPWTDIGWTSFDDDIPLTSTPRRPSLRQSLLFPSSPSSPKISAQLPDIGEPSFSTDTEAPSAFSHVAPDADGRLVINTPGHLPSKVPDFVVSRRGRAYIVVENKIRHKTSGIRQLHSYMGEFDPGTIGMTFSVGENGVQVAIFRRLEGGSRDDPVLEWLSDHPGQPRWFYATHRFVRETLRDIALLALGD